MPIKTQEEKINDLVEKLDKEKDPNKLEQIQKQIDELKKGYEKTDEELALDIKNLEADYRKSKKSGLNKDALKNLRKSIEDLYKQRKDLKENPPKQSDNDTVDGSKENANKKKPNVKTPPVASKKDNKKSVKNSSDIFFTIPGTPLRDGNTAINVPKFEGNVQVGNEEVAIKIRKGVVLVDGKRKEDERLAFIKMLSDAGFVQVKENDDAFKANSSEASNVKHEYSLSHPDADKKDEDRSEYELKYTEVGEPVRVIFQVINGVLKTSNKKWCDDLIGLGFVLDKDHVVK